MVCGISWISPGAALFQVQSCLQIHPFKIQFALFVISCHFMSFHVTSCHFMSFHVTSCHFMCSRPISSNFIIHTAKNWHSARMTGTCLRTFLTERTGIRIRDVRVNSDVVQKLERHLAESSGVFGVSSARVQSAIETSCDML